MDSIHHRFFTVKYLEALPKAHPCPDCGQLAKRNSKGERALVGAQLGSTSVSVKPIAVSRNPSGIFSRTFAQHIPL
jgi:hypothetical protein